MEGGCESNQVIFRILVALNLGEVLREIAGGTDNDRVEELLLSAEE